MYWLPYSSNTHSSSLTDSLPSLNLLCHSKTDARIMQDGRKAVWSIPSVSVAFLPSLIQNFIAYRSSPRPDCIFEINQVWQSGLSRVYSNCCCSCWFELELIKIGQSSHKMYSNNLLNFQESTTILNAHKKSLEIYRMSLVCDWSFRVYHHIIYIYSFFASCLFLLRCSPYGVVCIAIKWGSVFL